MLNLNRKMLGALCTAALMATHAAPAAAGHPKAGPPDPLGTPSSGPHADRTIVLTPETRWINVVRGEQVRIVAPDGKDFVWIFDTLHASTAFDLSRVAPRNIDVKGVRVYVEPSKLDVGL